MSDNPYEIVVNGQTHNWAHDTISYSEIVSDLAGLKTPAVDPTLTYRAKDTGHSGSLRPGDYIDLDTIGDIWVNLTNTGQVSSDRLQGETIEIAICAYCGAWLPWNTIEAIGGIEHRHNAQYVEFTKREAVLR